MTPPWDTGLLLLLCCANGLQLLPLCGVISMQPVLPQFSQQSSSSGSRPFVLAKRWKWQSICAGKEAVATGCSHQQRGGGGDRPFMAAKRWRKAGSWASGRQWWMVKEGSAGSWAAWEARAKTGKWAGPLGPCSWGKRVRNPKSRSCYAMAKGGKVRYGVAGRGTVGGVGRVGSISPPTSPSAISWFSKLHKNLTTCSPEPFWIGWIPPLIDC